MNEIKKNFGFGCMRLPVSGSEVDYAEFSKMVDAFWRMASTILTPPMAI